jgi:competence protein ComEA
LLSAPVPHGTRSCDSPLMSWVSFVIVAALLAVGSSSIAQTRPPAAAPAATQAAAQIDLNSASRDNLMTLDGIGEVRADAIIRARPFKAKTELVERHLIPEALYDKLAGRLTVRPPPVAPPAAAPKH